MLNACALCLYQLEGELKLKYSLLVSMDSNQSLKLVDSNVRGGTPWIDSQRIPPDLILSEDFVDMFKDEVLKSKRVSYRG